MSAVPITVLLLPFKFFIAFELFFDAFKPIAIDFDCLSINLYLGGTNETSLVFFAFDAAQKNVANIVFLNFCSTSS
jgi:hypothetical protein